MSQEDNPSPQGDSTSKTPFPSATPKNQANSTPATESEEPNNLTAETLSEEGEGIVEERGRFKERLHNIKELPHNINKYITEDNPVLDSNETNKKYPIDTLVSIFKIQKKDHKIIFWISVLLLTHMISYYLKWIYLVDLFRIAITAIFLIFAIKNTYSAYQNRPIIVDSFKKHPLQFFTTIITIGGLFALVIPAAMNVLKLIGDSSALTTAILTITGGFIAVFGLIKSHQKSELEREQLEVQKQKDTRDHTRQVHAARRDRYIEAVDKLSSDSAPVRLGGVYALVGLVDEWLTDGTLDTEERKKEGQVIINNLCSYIRSPFKLAEKRAVLELGTQPDNYQGNFSEDQVKLFEEQDVRRSIFNEISIRLPLLNEKEKLDYITWDVFEFNFQKSTVFYPLDRLTFFSPDFRNSKFFGPADFEFSDFREFPTFQGTQYFGDTDFSGAHFQGAALFQDSCFEKELNFQATTLEAGAIFDSSFFKGPTIITPVLQDGRVSFDGSMFNCSSEHKFPDSNHLDIPKIDIIPVTLVSKRRCKRYKAKIPVNSHLYDPDSWNEEEKKYDCISDSAQ